LPISSNKINVFFIVCIVFEINSLLYLTERNIQNYI